MSINVGGQLLDKEPRSFAYGCVCVNVRSTFYVRSYERGSYSILRFGLIVPVENVQND